MLSEATYTAYLLHLAPETVYCKQDFADGNFQCEFYTFIRRNHAGAVAKNATIDSLAGIEPVIPVQRSNQLSCKETVVEL